MSSREAAYRNQPTGELQTQDRCRWFDTPASRATQSPKQLLRGGLLGLSLQQVGELAGVALLGALSVRAPADASGKGGAIAEAAAAYNKLATQLRSQVNSLHRTGLTPSGVAGGDFFGETLGVPAALSLTVLPTDASSVAAAGANAGDGKGTMADRISQLGVADGGPDSIWGAYVVRAGVESRAIGQQMELADRATRAATSQQQSQASVDLDEETTLLLTYQHAYQGAARVMTAIDEMLDVLINRTGVVGR